MYDETHEILNKIRKLMGLPLQDAPGDEIIEQLREGVQIDQLTHREVPAHACTCNPLPSHQSMGALAQAGCGPRYERCAVCGKTWRCKLCGGCRYCRTPG